VYEIMPNQPPEIDAAILRCLEKDKSRHFPDVGAASTRLTLVDSRSARATPLDRNCLRARMRLRR
jgi:hypothetical protein